MEASNGVQKKHFCNLVEGYKKLSDCTDKVASAGRRVECFMSKCNVKIRSSKSYQRRYYQV